MTRRTLMLAPKRAKPWYRSETVWGNAFALIVTAAELHLGLLQQVLPGNVYAWLAFAVAFLNTVLKLRGSHLQPATQEAPDARP